MEHDLDQIDYIDSCATEEEEEEVRQPKCMDSDSLSSQFMAYIDQRRISNEVVLLLKLVEFIPPRKAFVMVLMLLLPRGFLWVLFWGFVGGGGGREGGVNLKKKK